MNAEFVTTLGLALEIATQLSPSECSGECAGLGVERVLGRECGHILPFLSAFMRALQGHLVPVSQICGLGCSPHLWASTAYHPALSSFNKTHNNNTCRRQLCAAGGGWHAGQGAGQGHGAALLPSHTGGWV